MALHIKHWCSLLLTVCQLSVLRNSHAFPSVAWDHIGSCIDDWLPSLLYRGGYDHRDYVGIPTILRIILYLLKTATFIQIQCSDRTFSRFRQAFHQKVPLTMDSFPVFPAKYALSCKQQLTTKNYCCQPAEYTRQTCLSESCLMVVARISEWHHCQALANWTLACRYVTTHLPLVLNDSWHFRTCGKSANRSVKHM